MAQLNPTSQEEQQDRFAWLNDLVDAFTSDTNISDVHKHMFRSTIVQRFDQHTAEAVAAARVEEQIFSLEEEIADIDEAILLWRKNERKHHTWLLSWLEDDKRNLDALKGQQK